MTHITHALDGGGLETIVADIATRCAGTSVVVSAISLSGRAGQVGSRITPLLDQYHVLTQVSGLSMVWPLELARAIRATKADVVHLHSGCWYKGSLAGRHAGAAVVYTEHGREHYDPWLMRVLDRRAARRTQAVVAVSDRLRAYLQRRLAVPAARLHVIQNGVDTSRFSDGVASAALRQGLGFPEGAFVVGSIGRLESVKAYQRLVDTVADLRAMDLGRPVVGVIWGEGSQRPVLEARIAERGLQDAFRLPGWIADPLEAHRLLDVFCLTSTSEGASISLMEAMASGAVPAVMDVGANAEVVGPSLAGQVVPDGDEAAFTALVRATLQDVDAGRGLREAARRRVVDHYSLDAMVAGYERVYREAAGMLRPARDR